MEACAGAQSRKVAEKEISYAGAGSKKAMKARQAGSGKAKERALSMLKNLELDEEKAHDGSKMEKEMKVLQSPELSEFPFSFEPLPGQEEGGKSGQSTAYRGRKRRKVTYRLGMEYIDYAAENPLPPLYLPDPRFSDLFMTDMEERFVAKQMAEREQRENILKQLQEFGYADVEIEAPDPDEDPFCKDGCMGGCRHGVLGLAKKYL